MKLLDDWPAIRDWLVGDKCTYADLAFVNWSGMIPNLMEKGGKEWNEDEFPNHKRWQVAMGERPSVKKSTSFKRVDEVHEPG